MYHIIFTKPFLKKVSSLTKKNNSLQKKLKKGLYALAYDPFHSSLNTRKVNSKKYGHRYSSTVTGDLRIIWDFGDQNLTIIALDFGGHSGKHGVYK